MKKIILYIVILVIALFTPCISATNYKEFADKKFIDLDSIHQSREHGFNPDEYLYFTLYLNDKSEFFTKLEEFIHQKISQVLIEKSIDCTDKTILVGSLTIFDDSYKKIINYLNFPNTYSRFYKSDIDLEYNEICKNLK